MVQTSYEISYPYIEICVSNSQVKIYQLLSIFETPPESATENYILTKFPTQFAIFYSTNGTTSL